MKPEASPEAENPMYGKFNEVAKSLILPQSPKDASVVEGHPDTPTPRHPDTGKDLRFIDLFCGVGGFHVAASALEMDCAFACDNDANCRSVYEQNFGVKPFGDIAAVLGDDVPDHDLLCAGFPCQPFSIIGKRRGFAEKRGFLFLEIARIVAEKRPLAILLENVKQLATASGGQVMAYIVSTLELLGYDVDWRVLNALDYGLPQKRERVFVAAIQGGLEGFEWPKPVTTRKSLAEILEETPDKRHFVSERIRRARHAIHKSEHKPSIWHENKGGNIASHPFSCALRAGASYNYLLVNGERRLTPREMFRLQGFPDSYILPESDAQARRQAGNAVSVPVVQSIIKSLVHALSQIAR